MLTVEGSGFVPQSEILWDQNPLPTTFIDSRHLQTTVTQDTFESYGGSAGKNVSIAVTSPGNTYLVGVLMEVTLARCPSKLISEAIAYSGVNLIRKESLDAPGAAEAASGRGTT